MARYEAPGLIIRIDYGIWTGGVGDGEPVVVSGLPGTLATRGKQWQAGGADSLPYFAGLHVPIPKEPSRFPSVALGVYVECKGKGEQKKAVRVLRSVEIRKLRK